MKPILLIILPFLLYYGISISCGPRNPSISQKILGKWEMYKIYQDGQDVTGMHDPIDNRWIRFRPNHQFQSDGDPYGPNSGKWKIEEQKSELFLDSDQGVDDDSSWKIEFLEEKMIWTGIHSEFARSFELHYIKN